MTSNSYKKLKETIRKIVKEIQDESIDEMTGTAATPGYLTPNAFSKSGQVKKKNKKMASLAGGKLVEGYTNFHISNINEVDLKQNTWQDVELKNLTDEEMEKIWDIYTNAYGGQGLDLSANSAKEFQSKYKAAMLIDVDGDNKIDAFIIYKPGKHGNKMALLAADITNKSAKREVVKKSIALVNTNGWYIEASAKMEDIMSSNGVPAVTDEDLIIKLIGGEKKPEFIGNGYYTRFLSKVNKRITKRIYGKPKP